MYKYLRSLKYKNLFYFKALIYIRQNLTRKLFSRGKNGVILNCGGPRSGSTLLNMIIKEVLLVGLESEDNYVDNLSDLSSRLALYKYFTLVKTHRYFPNVQGLIKRNQVIAFMTHRHIRDVVVSLCQKGWVEEVGDFIDSKDLKQISFSSCAYAKMKGMNIISYQELMDNPKSVIYFVCNKLDIKMDEQQIDAIVNSVSKENVHKKIRGIENDNKSEACLDSSTGLHKGHINDGKTGKWREFLSASESSAITAECQDYLSYFGYENE